MGTETRPGHWPEPLIGVGPVAVPIHLWIAPLAFRGLGVFALGDALVLPLVSWWDLHLPATDTTPAVSPEIFTMPEESLHALGTQGTGGGGPEGSVTGPTLAMYQAKPRVLPCANEALKVATLAAATPTKEICCAYAAAGRRTHKAAGSAFFAGLRPPAPRTRRVARDEQRC